MDIRNALGRKIILFEGAMGTALQAAGLGGGRLPEIWNIENSKAVRRVHAGFLKEGSDVLSTNTFSANRLKLEGLGITVERAVSAAIDICREAIDETGIEAFIALDIGPTGSLMNVPGGISADQVYELVREQAVAGAENGADFALFETFSDIGELKAGVLAVKENSNLPIFCSMTFQPNGRMLMGTDPQTAVIILEGIGVDAIGINCSLGPADTVPLLRSMAEIAGLPVFAQPNAGLPEMEGGEAAFSVGAEEFAGAMMDMLEAGAAAAGGCCGTTAEYISALRRRIEAVTVEDRPSKFPALRPEWYEGKKGCAAICAASPFGFVRVSKDALPDIAEMVPEEKRKWREAILSGDFSYPVKEATSRARKGAGLILIDADVFEGKAEGAIPEVMAGISARVKAPILLEGVSETLIKKADRYYSGRTLSGKDVMV